jgi:ActR/RegA family two-component response regulator
MKNASNNPKTLRVQRLGNLSSLQPGSGFDVRRDLRQRGINTPVIMLTARGQVVDRVLGLKLGADDNLTKPFAVILCRAMGYSTKYGVTTV